MSVINNLPQGGGGNIIKDLAKASTFGRVTMSSEQSAQSLYNILTLSDGTTFFALGDSSGGLYRSTGEIGEAAIEIASSGSFTYMVETENYALIGGTFVAGTVYLYNKSTKAATLLTFSTSGTWYKLYPVKALEDTEGIWVVVCGGTSSGSSYYYIGWCNTSANTFTLVTSYKVGSKSYANPYFKSVDNLLLAKTTTGVIVAGDGSYTLHIRRSDRAAVGAATSYSTNTVEVVAYGGDIYRVGAYGSSLTTSSTAYIVTVNAKLNLTALDTTGKGNVRKMLETANYCYYGIYGSSESSTSTDASTYTASMYRVNKSTGVLESTSYSAGLAYEVDDGWILYGSYNAIYFMDKATETVTQISSSATIVPYGLISVKVGDDYIFGYPWSTESTCVYYRSASHTITTFTASLSAWTNDSGEDVLIHCLSKDGQYLYLCGGGATTGYNIHKYLLSDMTIVASWTVNFIPYVMHMTDAGQLILANESCVYMLDASGTLQMLFARDSGPITDLAAYRKGDILALYFYNVDSYSYYTLLIDTKTLKCSCDSGAALDRAMAKQGELIYTNE